MARECQVCSKSVQVGNKVEIRGKAKYLGGVGTKVTGITRRKFVPNLQNVTSHCQAAKIRRCEFARSASAAVRFARQ